MNEPILLVDDDEVFLRILQQTLQHQKITSITATTPQVALEQMQQHGFAHAIVDLNIDGESGLNLIPELLAINADCEILILTGYASIATAVEAIRLGAKDYLCKPANAQDIIKALFSEKMNEVPPAISEREEPQFEPMSVKRMEWEHIQKVLLENDGNISATAEALKMHRRTLQRKLQKKPYNE